MSTIHSKPLNSWVTATLYQTYKSYHNTTKKTSIRKNKTMGAINWAMSGTSYLWSQKPEVGHDEDLSWEVETLYTVSQKTITFLFLE